MKYTVSRMALNQMYVSYLSPILEYSSVVWDGCTENNSCLLEKIQHEAARIVTGLTRSVSLQKLYRECGWVSLAERRKQQKLALMYKVTHNLVPSYITDLIPPYVYEISAYPLRNRLDISLPPIRTEICKRSCIPSSIKLWNGLSNTTREINSLTAFKSNIKPPALHIPAYFNVGQRYISVLHARLRNECSNLNYDLYKNHLRQGALCSCSEERENAEHFFFKCSKFETQRLVLFHSTRIYHPINTTLLLFGNESLSVEDNTTICKTVLHYIKSTKRF